MHTNIFFPALITEIMYLKNSSFTMLHTAENILHSQPILKTFDKTEKIWQS